MPDRNSVASVHGRDAQPAHGFRRASGDRCVFVKTSWNRWANHKSRPRCSSGDERCSCPDVDVGDPRSGRPTGGGRPSVPSHHASSRASGRTRCSGAAEAGPLLRWEAIGMTVSRRSILLGAAEVAGSGLVSACSGGTSRTPAGLVLPSQSPLTPRAGQQIVTRELTARLTTVDLGGTTVGTWTYGDSVPGPMIRATSGDLLRITVNNQLPVDTSVHWHGIALRNAADEVPGLTQAPIVGGSRFVYEFVAPDPGTYFYHPHVGVQLDRGLYAPIVIDDPAEPGDYDLEWIVVLDDWIDGTGTTPDDVLAGLLSSGSTAGMEGMDMGDGSMGDMPGMGGGSMGSSDSPLGDASDVSDPHHLINGRTGSAPDVLRARPGERVRLRIINAAADTILSLSLGDHRLTVTHTDGYPVEAQAAGAIYIGMGGRYDAVVTLTMACSRWWPNRSARSGRHLPWSAPEKALRHVPTSPSASWRGRSFSVPTSSRLRRHSCPNGASSRTSQ